MKKKEPQQSNSDGMVFPYSRVPFYKQKHCDFIYNLESERDTLEYAFGYHLKMGGAFWGLGALAILGSLENALSEEQECFTEVVLDELPQNRIPEIGSADSKTIDHRVMESVFPTSAIPMYANGKINRQVILRWVEACFDSDKGGYCSSEGHDPHVASTFYALMVLAMLDGLESVPHNKVTDFIKNLQLPDGSFAGDIWGEADGRFMCSAIMALNLLQSLDAIDRLAAVEWIMQCANYDGGFGNVPGEESHAAYTYCCVCSLAILGHLDLIDKYKTAKWLALRQIDGCGGFNGRPGKAPDVCYTWWVLGTLEILGLKHWIDKDGVIDFVLQCQDIEDGGIADRAGDCPDVFHTFFGAAGLALLGLFPSCGTVDPLLGLPSTLVAKVEQKAKKLWGKSTVRNK